MYSTHTSAPHTITSDQRGSEEELSRIGCTAPSVSTHLSELTAGVVIEVDEDRPPLALTAGAPLSPAPKGLRRIASCISLRTMQA
jgi:hypothetical protein